DQSTTGLQRFIEERAKALLLPAILCRMLLPDERVACDREEIIVIPSPKRPELDERSFEHGLPVHRGSYLAELDHGVSPRSRERNPSGSAGLRRSTYPAVVGT